jgi:hypothetical protein
MNLVKIHNGEDYSWWEWMGRGEDFRFNGKRVKIIRTFKKQHFGNKKESGYCEVFILDEETGEFKTHNDEPVTREIRARDVAMLWDEYSDERDRLQLIRNKEEEARRIKQEIWEKEYQERKERERIAREEREEREQLERAEHERQEREKVQHIYDWLGKRGIKENGSGKIKISITDQYVQVTIRRAD